MKRFAASLFYSTLATMAFIALPACADEPAPTVTTAPDGARIVTTVGALTAPSTAPKATIVADFLRSRGAGRAADGLQVIGESGSYAGRSHLELEQRVDGLRVVGAYVKAAVSERGELVQVIDRTVAVTAVTPATISDSEALAVVLAHHHYTAPAASKFFHRAPRVERVVVADEETGALGVGFEVETWTAKTNKLDYTVVDGDGEVVSVQLRTAYDTYRVFTEDPSKGGQTDITGGPSPESPSGWLGTGAQTTTAITGNNAKAYLDVDHSNTPDAGGTPVSDGNFLTDASLTTSPATAQNRAVAVQNLFYFNNVLHDTLYAHGFTESAGNFQTNNFGKGGAGNDPVSAEAQDGSGTDNANFSTPNDGSAPRMQMYLWTGVGPDAKVVVNGVTYYGNGSAFGAALTAAGTTGALAVYNDGTGDTRDACSASVGSLTGKVAIVNRGTCDFIVKVKNAQNAGAIAVVVANNEAGAPFGMGGSDRKIKIPSLMVNQADGATLVGLAGTSANLSSYPVVPLQIDGDIDADIVFHEYGHGLTWRMVGDMSGPLAGAIGEGASDVVAFLNNGDDRIGEYSYSDPVGIRRYPYTGYPLKYGAVTGAEVHDDGEIYAAAMWAVRENYLAAGLSDSNLMDDFVHGLDATPARPAFENMRDGMLAVAPAARTCLIWKGFAKLGIGVGASGTVSRRGVVTVVQSTTVPASCQP